MLQQAEHLWKSAEGTATANTGSVSAERLWSDALTAALKITRVISYDHSHGLLAK